MQVNYPDTINKLSHITPMTNTAAVQEPERQFPKFPTETSGFQNKFFKTYSSL
jgi:hypothetical protein